MEEGTTYVGMDVHEHTTSAGAFFHASARGSRVG
jgi:hypothetical protein